MVALWLPGEAAGVTPGATRPANLSSRETERKKTKSSDQAIPSVARIGKAFRGAVEACKK